MPRQKSGPYRKQRNKKILKRAKGFRAGRSKLLRAGKEAVMRAGQYAYFGRKNKKRDYRGMWIIRINAACDLRGIPYHRFINGLRKAKIELNRKALAELALSEPKAFDELVETAKKALAEAQPAAAAKK
ncbi:MAG TPA: 50S ribosomal protein L20 [Planctomycetota bacterium]|nr:50S ribosomal protein L20 [Planctomycetota bacterium]